jgi:hypothetical protein
MGVHFPSVSSSDLHISSPRNYLERQVHYTESLIFAQEAAWDKILTTDNL